MNIPNPFRSATHTLVMSDFHLADAEPVHPRNPLWKRFKRPKHFVDASFKLLLEELQHRIPDPIELVFNGDIFDFDSVMTFPEKDEFKMSWLERKRGLASEEYKSRYKLGVILDTHPLWVQALRDFIAHGNRVVFNIGNHDMELHWISVRKDLVAKLGLTAEQEGAVRFTEWFYISNGDTLIEHGNQYDAYCLCSNPINPLIEKGSKILVRLPFGNLAGKYMLNGMGLMNPHVESSFIKDSVYEYFIFYMKYVFRTQPFLFTTWFWSAIATLLVSLDDGFRKPVSDPLTIDARVEDIAFRSNATTQAVWALKEMHAHPAIFDPLKIVKELWLDRAILLGLVFFASFEFFTVINVFAQVSFWWATFPLLALLPMFIFYARSVESDVMKVQEFGFRMTPVSARIARVNRIIQGHTHRELHSEIDGIEYLNTGTWSPAFEDVECTKPHGRKCFAWIMPDSGARKAKLYEWTGTALLEIAPLPGAQVQPLNARYGIAT